ncbi:MAG: electron transfer flavoprotein subunit beta/FixA family protein [Gammaproteobacteria bacterium]|nr:electron transfer flavoprotein subunit beta/FixA family protein [Gammaproteobacteria bacterium]
MKVLVCVKRVVDFNTRIQVKSDGTGVQLDGVKFSMNPFDEIAVEEAIRLKEAGIASEVVAVSIGNDKSQDTLRSALAMGADSAVLINADQEVQPLAAAKALKTVVEQQQPKLVLMGKQAIDDDANQTGQMLAALLGWPQATFASELVIDGDTANVTREVDAGLETLNVDLPAVVTSDLRLNEPRYIKLPDIMKAKRKPLDTLAMADVAGGETAMIETVKTSAPPQRQAGIKVDSTEALLAELKTRNLV